VKTASLGLLLLPLFLPQEKPDITVSTDAWPKKSRAVGQKFGMNTRDNIATREIDGDRDDMENDEVAKLTTRGVRYRIVSVRVKNPTAAALIGVVCLPQVPSRRDVTIRAGEWHKVFVVVPDRFPKLKVELRDTKANLLAESETPMGPGMSGSKSDAEVIAWELQNEQTTRAKWHRMPITVQVRTAADAPIPNAALTLIHARLGLLVDAKTDAKGDWTGAALVGDWQVFARAQIDPPPPKEETPTKPGGTQVEEKKTSPATDLYHLFGLLAMKEGSTLKLVPDRTAKLSFDGEPDRLLIVPSSLTEALRYQAPHAAVADAFTQRVDLARIKGRPLNFHSTSNLAFDVMTWEPAKRLTALARLAPAGDVKLAMAKPGAITFDPAKFPGGEKLDVSLTFPEWPRERFDLHIEAPVEIIVPAGLVRIATRATMKRDSVFHFSPHLATVLPGKGVDQTPGPLSIMPHYQESRGLMVWICIQDAVGRVVRHIDNPFGEIFCWSNGKEMFRRDLKELTMHFPNEFKNVPLATLTYAVSLDAGGTPVKFAQAKAKPRKEFIDAPAKCVVPEDLEERARAILPMIKKTLAGSLKTFGIPKFDLSLNFEIRLPPEVGGLGGGGTIQLDLGEILQYAHETDALPGAYTHELGHCLGFGHDPYMTMAPCGVDEGLYGERGYKLLMGRSLAKLLGYLDRDSDSDDRWLAMSGGGGAAGVEWTPDGAAYASMRMLYAFEVHERMFEMRRKNEARLVKAGFSIPEQQAAYYAEVTAESPAWIFRAFGWPVFDYRVWLAQQMIRNQALASAEKLPKKIDGSYLTTWWVRGPIAMGKEAPADYPWKIHQWDGRFVMLASEDDFLKEVGWHFYLTIRSAEDRAVLLAVGSDCQVSFYLNGKRVSRVAAAPQFTQPAHDGYTMERGNATIVPITLRSGDNALEMTVVKPSGSKGIFLEIAGLDGKPLKDVGYTLEDGPDGADPKKAERVKHATAPPIFNPSFETGAKLPTAWARGAKDGDGECDISLDAAIHVDGKQCVKLEAKGAMSGSILQRIIVEEKANYEFTVSIHTEGFRAKVDRAWVMFFTGDASQDEGFVRTEFVDTDQKGWKQLKFEWKADRREFYVACVLRAGGGAKAWFDGLTLTKK